MTRCSCVDVFASGNFNETVNILVRFHVSFKLEPTQLNSRFQFKLFLLVMNEFILLKSSFPLYIIYISSVANNTETMVTKLTASIDSIVTKSNLPPLDVVKFSGNPCEYFRFRARFVEMVGTQNISENQKMSRLLQFLEGQARGAVAGFQRVPGGLSKALNVSDNHT